MTIELRCNRCGGPLGSAHYGDGDGRGQKFACASCYEGLSDDETRGVELPSDLRVYNAFVAVEYDFQVIARSEAEALEAAKRTWMQALASYQIAHAEVELPDEVLDSPDLSE